MASLTPPHPLLESSQPPLQPSFSYIALTLRRDPKIQPSWGLVFTKEQSCHAFIVGVNRTHHIPSMMTWCRITRQIPHPSLVYQQHSGITAQQYEQILVQNFPIDDINGCASINNNATNSNNNSTDTISSPNIQPGDAILSINGISVSSFPSIQSLASFIRQHCQQTMTMIVMRHEVVWKATRWAKAREEELRKADNNAALSLAAVPPQQRQQQQQQRNKNLVATTVKHSWITVNNKHHNNSNQTASSLIHKPTSPSTIKKKRKLTQVDHQFNQYDNRQLHNPMFKDQNGNPILYCDNDEFEPDDGNRIHMFLNDEIERDFSGWFKKRKATWREKWRLSIRTCATIVDNDRDVDDDKERGSSTVVEHDFWLSSGYETFDQWLVASKIKWRRSYSWHVDRIHQLEEECEKTVHLPYSPVLENAGDMEQFKGWLNVRKQQWKIERRKRQRRQQHRHHAAVVDSLPNNTVSASSVTNGIVERSSSNATTILEATSTANTTSNDTMYIDEMLEKQEECDNNAAGIANQQPMDVSWIFNSQLGAPDDVILVIMKFLQPFEHGNLLCLSYTSTTLFKQRDTMWKSLCPKHWVLPRRPRKSWCVMYITKIRAEEEAFRKSSDDLLVKANAIIEKGDLLNKLEKLVKKAEKDFRFDVNYTSGVVLERNSLLNMAIIDKRTKIAKWLLEQKNADIESWDRGQFTPLLNAAWNGDKHMVRYLLARGADRTKTGLNHSSKGLAPAGFSGLRAEEWARQRGHHDVAELIRIGI
ncbi:hypothetical protein ACHAWT_009662 [Skeletonema menzelii]